MGGKGNRGALSIGEAVKRAKKNLWSNTFNFEKSGGASENPGRGEKRKYLFLRNTKGGYVAVMDSQENEEEKAAWQGKNSNEGGFLFEENRAPGLAIRRWSKGGGEGLKKKKEEASELVKKSPLLLWE